jgi:hypothetical protein
VLHHLGCCHGPSQRRGDRHPHHTHTCLSVLRWTTLIPSTPLNVSMSVGHIRMRSDPRRPVLAASVMTRDKSARQ